MRPRLVLLAVAAVATLSACAGTGEGTVRLYTSVTEDTVEAVLDARSEPGAEVEVFRAPTGEIAARIAAEQREGGLQADVLWLTDPLSLQQYAADGLLAEWSSPDADAVPPEFRTGTFVGTRILNLVIIHGEDVPEPPSGWWDLARNDLGGEVAVPDPGFAGSAFAALAYFALTPDYGFDYYRQLADNGGVQVRSPGDVVSGVAEGQFAAGITLARVAGDAVEQGSPIEMVWPEPGAIALYSPIAVVAGSPNDAAARSFASFVLTREAQEAIAATGWQPARDDIAWEEGGPQVTIDCTEAFDRQQELLDQYQEAFGS